MQRSLFTEAELRLVTERCLKYQGTAKVNLNQIHFHSKVSKDLDSKNLERLCRIFRQDRCRRLEVQNHVPAVVSKQSLETALRGAQVTARELLTSTPDQFPHLHFPARQLQCLHGKHRIKAGEELLPHSDRWWTVDIYLDGMSYSSSCGESSNSLQTSMTNSAPA